MQSMRFQLHPKKPLQKLWRKQCHLKQNRSYRGCAKPGGRLVKPTLRSPTLGTSNITARAQCRTTFVLSGGGGSPTLPPRHSEQKIKLKYPYPASGLGRVLNERREGLDHPPPPVQINFLGPDKSPKIVFCAVTTYSKIFIFSGAKRWKKIWEVRGGPPGQNGKA
eukprot:EG_transcript_16910